MKVHDNVSKPGRIWSIEVSSWIGRRKLSRVLARIPGVTIERWPSLLSWLRPGPFCTFAFQGRTYTVEATWPAGSRFEISPEPRGCEPGLLQIRGALIAYRPLGTLAGA